MSDETYIAEVQKLLALFYGVVLGKHGLKAAAKAQNAGLTPGQFVVTVARKDDLEPL